MCTSICSTQPRHTSNEVLACQYFLLLVAFSYPPFLFADAPAWRVVGTIWGKVRTLSSPFRTALELSIPKPTTIAKCRPQLILWLRWLWWSWGSLVCAWFMLILLQYCLLGLLEHHWEILRAFHSVSRFGMFQLSGWLRWTVTHASERCQQQATYQQGLSDGEQETQWPLKSALEAPCPLSSGWSEVSLSLPWWWQFVSCGGQGKGERRTKRQRKGPSRPMTTWSRMDPVMRCNLWWLPLEHLQMPLLRHLLQAFAQACTLMCSLKA